MNTLIWVMNNTTITHYPTLVLRLSVRHTLGVLLGVAACSPLAPPKNRKGRGEPVVDSHVILRHDDFALAINIT